MTYSKIYSPCDDCPHSFSKNNQESNVCKICEFNQALDLINRQKAEIERLKEECSCLGCENEWLKAHLEQAKAEAIKEVIARVKEYVNPDISFEFRKWLDSLEKELVGEG